MDHSYSSHVLRLFIDKFGITGNLPEIYDATMTEIIKFLNKLGFENVTLSCDQSPDECIQNKQSYVYTIRCNDTHDILCHLPKIVMQKPLHYRGYFIIEGIEKFMMSQEIISKHIFHVRHDNEQRICCSVRLPNSKRGITINFEGLEILMETDALVIPLYNIIRYLGYNFSDVHDTLADMHLDPDISTTCETLLLIGSGDVDATEIPDTLIKDYFNELENDEILATLVYICYLLIGCSLNKLRDTDLSNYSYKILRTYSDVIKNVFTRSLKNFDQKTFIQIRTDLMRKLDRELFQQIKTGVTEIFGRTYDSMVTTVSRRSELDAISSVRKIIIPTDENTKNINMRMIHSSHIMFICPSETPEGRRVGLVRTLATSCIVSDRIDHQILLNELNHSVSDHIVTWLILDARLRKIHRSIEDIYQNLVRLKRTDDRFRYISFVRQSGLIFIRLSRGRVMRPVIPLRLITGQFVPPDWLRIKTTLTWDHLIQRKLVVYIDALEQTHSQIYDPISNRNEPMADYDYHEIDPSFMLGLSASLIPYSEHNQCARTVFASSMMKQGMQMSHLHPNYVDHKSATYAQRPCSETIVAEAIGYHDRPNGINVVMALTTYLGFNQEDAIVMKKSFIDRLGLSSKIIKIVDVEFKVTDIVLTISNNSDSRYERGIIKRGSRIKHGDVFMVYARLVGDENYVIEMEKWNEDEEAVISEIIHTNQYHLRFVTQRFRKIRVGDKLTSRHSQKGVVSHIVSEENLPFTEQGIIPDIVINPHAIPSRMTIGHLLESVIGKQVTLTGKFADGTTFSNKVVPDLLDRDLEYMYCPYDGNLIDQPISIGVIYYIQLAHQSIDKIHHRSYGENSALSNQPVAGRAKGGGLRIGEMEIDCLLTHGTSELIRTVARDSDMTIAYICKSCGYCLSSNEKCLICDNITIEIEVPFSFKNICNVFQALNIKVSADLKN